MLRHLASSSSVSSLRHLLPRRRQVWHAGYEQAKEAQQLATRMDQLLLLQTQHKQLQQEEHQQKQWETLQHEYWQLTGEQYEPYTQGNR